MKREAQIALVQELLDHLDARSTAHSESMVRNEVSAYTDKARWRQEQKILFGALPVFMGLSCLLPKVGDFRVESIGALAILLVRDRDHGIKAFANVCRHRGAPVAEGCGNARAFVCPYHGWSYGLDGRLLSITDEAGFPGLDRGAHHLVPLPAGEKYGLIYVRPQPAAAGENAALDVETVVAGLGAELEPFALSSYSHFRSESLTAPINWKFAIDTFLEAYHVGFLHKNTVAPIFFGNLAGARSFGQNCRMSALRKSAREMRSKPQAEWDALKHCIVLYTLFPNTVLIYQADHVETWRVFPSRTRVDECTVTFSLYTPQPAVEEKAQRYWLSNFDLAMRTVRDEDFTLGASIQQGFFSGAQDHITYGRNEPALIHFHQSLRQALGLAPL